MNDTEIKLAKAITALNDLTGMVREDHSIRKSEAWARVNNTLAVLNGTTEMPEHWRESPPVSAAQGT